MAPLPPTRERSVAPPQAPQSAAWGDGGPQRPKRRWPRRIGIILLVLFAIMLGAFAALAFVAKQEIDDFVTPKNAAMRQAQRQLAEPLPGKPTNVLLLGSDHRNGTDEADRRSDTLLLVRLDPKRKSISMLSFPRDLYVEIPGHGQAKINDAYSLGGPALSVETVKEITGLDVNFVMDVDFKGFRGVVDSLGGVWVDVDRRYFNDNSTGGNYAEIDIEPGYQLLDGRDALAFARFRHTDSDFHRIARQQQLLGGLKKQISASKVARNVPGLFKVLKENTQVVGGGGNGVPARILYDYLRLALELGAKDIYQIELEAGIGTGPGGASIVEYDEATMDSAVDAFLEPSSEAREETADQLVGKPTEARAPADAEPEESAVPDPSTVTVTVLNGSGVGGAAGEMAAQLASAGYRVDPDQTNADNAAYASTRVQYGPPRAKAAAEALADRISGAVAEPTNGANQFDTQLLVIVGKQGTIVESVDGVDGESSSGQEYEGNVVPPKATARVTTDAEYGRDDFSTVGQLPFTLMYPTVREQSSSYEEVRAYRIAKGKTVYDAFRLVAETGAGDYWGLQGTDWPDPPLLEDATREVTRGRRRYRLFFNGTKLHMISWREGTGTYWVTNSVLDKLSNETMLAIADGVRVYR